MMALINTPQYEEVMENLADLCTTRILDEGMSNKAYDILEAYATDGSTEEFLYTELDILVSIANVVTEMSSNK